MVALVWAGFVALVLALLALDLGVLRRKDRAVSIKEALLWSGFWITLAMLFNVFVFFLYEHHWLHFGQAAHVAGREAALQFLTGYLVEKSLSVDNIFVIAVIFTYFGIPLAYQHRVLYWGIVGALVLRGLMIGAGAVLIASFSWMNYVFGSILLVTAVKLLLSRDESVHPDRNIFVRLLRRLLPVASQLDGHRFTTRLYGRVVATPLLVSLIVVETSDVLFAVDSIPAIFAITTDPFIVFTSNVFAILGLRALYFALAGIIEKFRFIKLSLFFVLAFIGFKMMLAHHLEISTGTSLAVIAATLAVGTAASLLVPGKTGEKD